MSSKSKGIPAALNPGYCRVCGTVVCRRRLLVGGGVKPFPLKEGWDEAMPLSRTIGPTVQGRLSKGEAAAGHPGGAFKKMPTLVQWLTETAWDNGDAREPGSLLIFAQDLRWKGMLTDKDNGYVCFVTAEDVDGVLAALEKGLLANSLDWRESRGAHAKGKR